MSIWDTDLPRRTIPSSPTFTLSDDGTLDTVITCDRCGRDERFTIDFEGREHDDECVTLCPVPANKKCRISHSCWCTSDDARYDEAVSLAIDDHECSGAFNLLIEDFPHPQDTDSAEYRAIWDCVNDALHDLQQENDDDADAEAHVLTMLNEFEGWVKYLRERLTGDREMPECSECGEPAEPNGLCLSCQSEFEDEEG